MSPFSLTGLDAIFRLVRTLPPTIWLRDKIMLHISQHQCNPKFIYTFGINSGTSVFCCCLYHSKRFCLRVMDVCGCIFQEVMCEWAEKNCLHLGEINDHGWTFWEILFPYLLIGKFGKLTFFGKIKWIVSPFPAPIFFLPRVTSLTW